MATSHQDVATFNEALDTTWQGKVALGLTGFSSVVVVGTFTVTNPATTIAMSAGIGVLAYAGHNRANGRAPLPFFKKDEDAPKPVAQPVDTTVVAS